MIKLNFEDEIISAYNYIGEFHEGLARVSNSKDLWGYIDKKGNEVIPCQFSNIASNFCEGRAATGIKKNRLEVGYIDKTGKTIISHELEYGFNFSEGLAFIKHRGLRPWECIDKNGDVCARLNVDHIGRIGTFHDGRAVLEYDNSYCFIDTSGNLRGMFSFASNFEDGIAIIRQGTKFMTVNKDYEVQNTLLDSDLSPVNNNLSCGMLMVKNGKDIGYLNRDLELKIPTMYCSGYDFKDDMAIVQFDENTISIVDKNGKNITFSKKYQYSEIKNFSEGLAAVQNAKTGLWGYINKEGKEVISCQYEGADDFSEGLAGVLDTNDRLCYINKSGVKQILINNEYNSVLNLDDKVIYITADSEEELNKKKLQVLNLVKKEYVKKITDDINDVSSDIISELYEISKIKKLN